MSDTQWSNSLYMNWFEVAGTAKFRDKFASYFQIVDRHCTS